MGMKTDGGLTVRVFGDWYSRPLIFFIFISL
jgi:hypothetical protein